MAIGTLVPKLRACWTNNCTEIEIYDTTLPYNAATNTGGWGPTNIDAADLDTATITYTNPDGDETTVDVTAAVNAQTTVTDEFLLTTITTEANDGSWTFLYTCTEAGVAVTYEITPYSTCSVRCCVDKFWAKSAKELEEDCGCSGSSQTYTNKALKGEALILSIQNGAACSDTTTKDALLAKLQRICSLENCNCN